MASSSEKHIADLRAMLSVSRELAATSELQTLLQRIVAAARKVLGCERATIFLYDRARAELFSSVATGVHKIRISVNRGVAGEAARTGKVVKVDDAYADPRFDPDVDRRTGFRTRNMIAFPLIGFDNTVVGVLQVLNKVSGPFDDWDNELVSTFGAQAGVAVQRQILLDEFVEKQRIQRDLTIARTIQQTLLPARPPQAPGFDIAGWNKPADETGGDCFDFLELRDGRLAILVADATGHGIGAALMIAECRALFRAMISSSDDLSGVSSRVNDLLCEDLLDDKFITAFLSVLNPAEQTLSFLSAGHGPLIKYTRAKDDFTELPANAVALGVMPSARFDAPDKFVMQPSDMMILVTDGFLEWANHEGERFGAERLCDEIRRHRDLSSAEIIQRMHDAVVAFSGGTHQSDDVTAVIIKRLGLG